MALTLTPDDIKRLQEKELANAIRKLGEGKTLTAAERALIAQAGVGGSGDSGGFAASWDELGDRLGVTRRAIQEWRKDPRYRDDCPPDRADGRKEVAAWAAFIQKHGLKNAALHAPLDTDDDDGATVILPPKLGGTVADWNARIAKLKGDKIERELNKEAKEILVASALEIPIGTAFVAITNRVNQLAETLAPIVTGQMDVQDVIDLIRPETQSIMLALGTVDYDAELDALLGDLPTDRETERLLQLVTFDGQDVAALHQLIRHCCQLVLRKLGRVAQTCPTAETSPAEAKSLQTREAAEKTPKLTPEAADKNRSGSSTSRSRKQKTSPNTKRKPAKKK